jgi:hypothetical protein
MLMVSEWSAERVGGRPELPKAESADSNLVLLKREVQPDAIEPTADGVSLKYRVAGKYVYAVKNPDAAVMTGGMLPWVSQQAASEAALREGDFGMDIVDGGRTSGSPVTT